MDKKPTSRDIKNLQTRQLILNTANRLFQEQRYENVTINDICRESGVSVGSFYHHFSSKEQLVELYYQDFDRYLAEYVESFRRMNALEALGALVSREMDYLETNTTYPTQICIMQLSAGGSYVSDSGRVYYNCMDMIARKLLDEKVVHHISHTELKATLIRCIRGVVYDWCLHRGAYNLKTQALRDIRLVIAGLRSTAVRDDPS